MNPLLAALVTAGIITQDDADRINRSMDPAAARAWAEQQLAIAVQGGLTAQQARLVELVRRNGTLTAAQLEAFWRAEDDLLHGTIAPAIEQIALERAAVVAIRLPQPDMWRLVNEQVLGWAQSYYTSANPDFVGSVRNLNETSRQQVAEAFTRWNRGELNDGRQGGLPALIQELEKTFDPVRAERIAVTETTRIFSEAENAAAAVDPDMEMLRWDTAFDELVCPICLPLDGRVVRKGEEFAPGIMLPPAHVNCRCGITATTKAASAAMARDFGKGEKKAVEAPAAVPVAPAPAPVVAEPVQKPIPEAVQSEPTKTLTPAGKPIKTALDSSVRLKKDRFNPDGGVNMKPVVNEAAGRIGKVHGIGNAPPVSIQQMTAGEREFHGAAGLYNPETTRSPGDPRPAFAGGDILLDTKSKALNQQATLTHEIGHYLDNKVIGKSGEWSSVSDPLFDEWRRAVDETKGIKTLKAYKADPALMEKETGIPRLIQPSDKMYDYLLDYRESWARSYMQYIAEKSGDVDLLTVHDSWTVRSQWDTEDFAPVAKAIDNLFLKLGWLK